MKWRHLITLGFAAAAAPALAAGAAEPDEAAAAKSGPADLVAPVRIAAADGPIDVDVGHAAPFYADFDGDKTPDLLVGQFGDGKLRIYRNEGSAKEPVFKNFTWFKTGADLGTVPAG